MEKKKKKKRSHEACVFFFSSLNMLILWLSCPRRRRGCLSFTLLWMTATKFENVFIDDMLLKRNFDFFFFASGLG